MLRIANTKDIPIQLPLVGEQLAVPQIRQEKMQWCWAACADMVLDHYGNAGIKQCDLAGLAFDKKCCPPPSGSPSSFCNLPLSDKDITQLWKDVGIRRRYLKRPVSFATLQSEIHAGRPVQVAFSLNGGKIGHVVIVRGWGKNTKGSYLSVNDPGKSRGSGQVLYAELLTAGGNGKWDATWTGLQR